MKQRRTMIGLVAVLFVFTAVLAVMYALDKTKRHLDVVKTPPNTKTVHENPPDPPLAWNTYHGDNALSGYAPQSVLSDQLVLMWTLKTNDPVSNPPVIMNQRLFCVTSHGEVIAADMKGNRLWSKELYTGKTVNNQPERERTDAPIACYENLVFVGTMGGNVYALDALSGDLKWKTDAGGPIGASPNYLPASGTTPSRIYVIERAAGILFCFDLQTGKEVWRSTPVDRCESTPGLSDKALVFGSCAAALHGFSPENGNAFPKIEIDPDSQVAGGVAVDGKYAVSGSRSGKIVLADFQSGKIVWANTDSKAEIFTTPAITPQWVIAGANDNTVYALERQSGMLRWKYDLKGTPTSPVIAGNKVVVCAEGTLFLLKLDDGVLLWSTKVSDTISSPAVTRHDIYVGSEDGAVYAYGSEWIKGP